MPAPTIPSTGPVDMGTIRNAFPGLSNPPNLAGFFGMHPSLPGTAGSSISFGQFHGLTAVSPTFSFSNASLSNGTVTTSNGALVISGSASVSQSLSGLISLSNYLCFVTYNAPVTFALSNGSSLPINVSLGSNGIMAHALTAGVTSTTFVIATNRWGNISHIPLVYTVSDAGLYAFTSFTFTSAGQNFDIGPTLAMCKSSYSSVTWVNDPSLFNMQTQGIQRWTVPKTGAYRIIAAGAQGGAGTGGRGIILQMDATLTMSTVISILVGQCGGIVSSGGGGGGTFVVIGSTPIIIAGGGGGCCTSGYGDTTFAAATINTSGQPGTGSLPAPYSGGGGANGGGGGGDYFDGGGGGAGFTGGGGQNNRGYGGGVSFMNGGQGGSGESAYAAKGGFGGGGAAGNGTQPPNYYGGGGGGGGYSGGGGCNSGALFRVGGGGGSYGMNTLTNMGANAGVNGHVQISLLA